MVYPLFEYTLIIYLVLHFFVDHISYKRGYVSERYWNVAKCIFPVQIVLCAWFRMIFVVLAYDNVRGHTAGFLGLQLALITVAIQNTTYILETKPIYPRLGGNNGTRLAAHIYLVGNVTISIIKVYLTSYVVFGLGLTTDKEKDGVHYGHIYPQWALQKVNANMVVGEVVDIIWMFFNAVLPFIISFVRSRYEPGLEFTIGLKPPQFLVQE
jgi:hypothetical protein